MMREFSFDQRKFQEFVHHALRCGHDASEVGIGHLLYDIDADAYLHLEAPIVGGEYVRRGDHPAPKFLEETLSVMASEGTIFFVSGRDGIREVVFWPNGDPDLSVFSPEEADIIERWCSPDVSPTRKTVWKCVDEGETVPYELGFIAEPRPLTERETEIGLAVAAFYGLLKKKTASKMSAEQVAKIEAYHKERGWEVPRELWTVSRLRGAKNRA